MAFENIIYQREGPICYLTLNRPEKLNALNAALLGELREALAAVDADPEVRVAILTGAGRAFSAGFDIERPAGEPDLHQVPADDRREHLKGHIDTFMTIWNLGKPVIAAVNGLALAGACELVQVCDIKIASDRGHTGGAGNTCRPGPAFPHHAVQRWTHEGQGAAADRGHHRRSYRGAVGHDQPGGAPR